MSLVSRAQSLQRVHPVAIDTLALGLLSLLILGAGIGLRNPWPADEPAYALIARDMLASGHWLVPMAGGDYYQDKPPLFFWLIAAAYAVTGSAKIGFLLPSLLAGIGTVLLVYDLGRRLWNREAGLLAAMLLLVTVQFTLQARRAQIDATLMLCTTLCLYCLLRHLLLGEGWKWYLAAGLAAGLGVLAKIVGFLPFMIVAPYLFARWRGWGLPRSGFSLAPRTWPRLWPWLIAPLACAAVAALWIVPLIVLVAHSGDPQLAAYRDEVLLQQTVSRYVTPWHHVKPFYYYLQVILTTWMPLTLLLPWLVPRWRQSLQARDARILLLLGYVVLCLLFFSASPGKREIYILPALPAAALCAGPFAGALLRRRGVQWTCCVFLMLLIGASAGAFFWFTSSAAATPFATLVRDQGLESFAPLLVLVAGGLILLRVLGRRRAPLALALQLGLAWLILGYWVGPQIDAARSGAAFIAHVEQRADPRRELGLLEYREQFLWNIRRPSVNFGHRRFREGKQESYDAARWLNEDPRRQLLVAAQTLAPCFTGARAKLDAGVTARSHWFIVSGPADPACAARGQAGRAITYLPAWLSDL